MINLSYTLSPTWNVGDIDWANADETTLRYRAFLGDQMFFVNEADFSARWGWIPILDFAASFVRITEGLTANNAEARFDFTESDAQLQFHHQGDSVLITSNYSKAQATVAGKELNLAVACYAGSVLKDALNVHPELKDNRTFALWYPRII
jgi:hypothetical protein